MKKLEKQDGRGRQRAVAASILACLFTAAAFAPAAHAAAPKYDLSAWGTADWAPEYGAYISTSGTPFARQTTIGDSGGSWTMRSSAERTRLRQAGAGTWSQGSSLRFTPVFTAARKADVVVTGGPTSSLNVALRLRVDGTLGLQCTTATSFCAVSARLVTNVKGVEASTQVSWQHGEGVSTSGGNPHGLSYGFVGGRLRIFGDVVTAPAPVSRDVPFPVHMSLTVSAYMSAGGVYQQASFDADFGGTTDGVMFQPCGPVLVLPAGFDADGEGIVDNRSSEATAPVAADDTVSTTKGVATTIRVLDNDADTDGEPLTIASVGAPGHGTVAINDDGTLAYTPTAGFSGTDGFTYALDDGCGGTVEGTVTVDVRNQAPVAVDDGADTYRGTAIEVDVMANDSDPDGDTIEPAIDSEPENGTVAVTADGTMLYTPEPGFVGTDTFAYTIDDGDGGTAVGTVAVNVLEDAAGPSCAERRIDSTTMDVDVLDDLSGVSSIRTVVAHQADVTIPPFEPGSRSVTVRVQAGSGLMPLGAAVLELADRSGNVTHCTIVVS